MRTKREHKLYQKTGIAISRLAMNLLSKKAGDRIPTIAECQVEFQVSRGTVQNAFQYLKDNEAITIRSYGHLGSFIETIDYGRLQFYGIQKDFLGIMPLPYSVKYEGFATAIYEELSRYHFNMAYARGAVSRINLVESGSYQFAVCSQYAAEKAIGEGKDIEVVLNFGPGSFLSRHILLLRDKEKNGIEDGMRVAYDAGSTDQSTLTKEIVAGKNVKLVDMKIQNTISALRDNRIDAGIWNYDAMDKNQDEVKIVFLDGIRDMDQLSAAVIVIKKNNHALKEVLISAIDIMRVLKTVEDVEQGKKKSNF